jgi:membrane protein YdbS with pleckstrin-like domain
MLTRWFQGRPVFTDRDWRFLFDHPREKVFTVRLWLRVAALWLAVVLVGLGIVFYVMPYGLIWSAGAVLLGIVAILLVTPKWLR